MKFFASWLGWNSVETVVVVAAQTVVPCALLLYNALISILSPRGVSTANLSCWLVLNCCMIDNLARNICSEVRLEFYEWQGKHITECIWPQIPQCYSNFLRILTLKCTLLWGVICVKFHRHSVQAQLATM